MSIKEYAVKTFGNPSDTPVLVLHSAPGGNGILGDKIPDIFTDKGMFLIVPTRKGYPPRNKESYSSFEESADEFYAILEHYQISKTAVVTLSGGGPYGLAFAAFHPEKVDRLELIGSPGDPKLFLNSPNLNKENKQFIESYFNSKEEYADLLKQYHYEKHSWGLASDFNLIFRKWNLPLSKIKADVVFHSGNADVNAPIESIQALIPKINNSIVNVLKGFDHSSFNSIDFWEKFSQELINKHR